MKLACRRTMMALKVAPREHSLARVLSPVALRERSLTNVNSFTRRPSRTFYREHSLANVLSRTFPRKPSLPSRTLRTFPHQRSFDFGKLVAGSNCSVRYWTWLCNFALQCEQAFLSFSGRCLAVYPCSLRMRQRGVQLNLSAIERTFVREHS